VAVVTVENKAVFLAHRPNPVVLQHTSSIIIIPICLRIQYRI